MNEAEFKELLAKGREQRGVEFKGPGARKDKHFLAKVVRAAISMANRRDGGLVIVGVDEDKNGLPTPIGLTDEQVRTWGHDDLADSIAPYVDPSVDFDSEILDVDGHKHLVIRIREFDGSPVLCKKSCGDVLRSGACYVRSRRKPETVDIPTHADMRDLIDLAVEKGVRRFLSQARAAGLGLADAPIPSDLDYYGAQIDGITKELE